jgi:hypothetical protein
MRLRETRAHHILPRILASLVATPIPAAFRIPAAFPVTRRSCRRRGSLHSQHRSRLQGREPHVYRRQGIQEWWRPTGPRGGREGFGEEPLVSRCGRQQVGGPVDHHESSGPAGSGGAGGVRRGRGGGGARHVVAAHVELEAKLESASPHLSFKRLVPRDYNMDSKAKNKLGQPGHPRISQQRPTTARAVRPMPKHSRRQPRCAPNAARECDSTATPGGAGESPPSSSVPSSAGGRSRDRPPGDPLLPLGRLMTPLQSHVNRPIPLHLPKIPWSNMTQERKWEITVTLRALRQRLRSPESEKTQSIGCWSGAHICVDPIGTRPVQREGVMPQSTLPLPLPLLPAATAAPAAAPPDGITKTPRAIGTYRSGKYRTANEPPPDPLTLPPPFPQCSAPPRNRVWQVLLANSQAI